MKFFSNLSGKSALARRWSTSEPTEGPAMSIAKNRVCGAWTHGTTSSARRAVPRHQNSGVTSRFRGPAMGSATVTCTAQRAAVLAQSPKAEL